MKKPSIFSKDYEKKKKKRRRVYISLFGTLVVFTVAGTTFVMKGIEDKRVNVEGGILEQASTNKDNTIEEDINIVEREKRKEEKNILKKEVSVGDYIIIVESDSKGRIVEASTKNRGITLDINPSNNKILVSDDINQKNIIIDNTGEIKDISIDIYKSSKGGPFKKDNILKQYEGYIWSKNAKFIDDENIAYITNRPYFSHKIRDEYIGITNINTLENKISMKTKGEALKLEESNDEGIKVTTKNGNYILNSSGTIIR